MVGCVRDGQEEEEKVENGYTVRVWDVWEVDVVEDHKRLYRRTQKLDTAGSISRGS